MMVAQQLYEESILKEEGTIGLVSYIRTDSVRISDEAYEDVKTFIGETYGEIMCFQSGLFINQRITVKMPMRLSVLHLQLAHQTA